MAEPNTNSGNRKNIRILVAEDNDINQKLIRQILEKAGYSADLVDNGRQAVDSACRVKYDMILMDIQMPVMDGYEATKRIRDAECEMRKRNPEGSGLNSELRIPNSALNNVPVIALTGTDLDSVKEKCLSRGMNDCIGKPLSREQLLSLIPKWTGTESAGSSQRIPDEVGKPVLKKLNPNRPIDLDKALNEFMGEKEVLYSLLDEFVEKVRIQIKAIQKASPDLDFKQIAREAHSIKGGAANLTANKVAGIASALEKAADLNQAELAGMLAVELEEKFLQLESYLQNENILVHGI
jgi:CheY-like chemotaxis protein